MIKWYLAVKTKIRSIETKARDALELYQANGQDAADAIKEYIEADYDDLLKLWRQRLPNQNLGNLARHIKFGKDCDYRDIVKKDLPALERKADSQLASDAKELVGGNLKELLHPIILRNAYELYQNGHLREAVLNSVTAVFDYIRKRTRENDDGDALIGKVFSLNNPILILSELNSQSGQNDQKGFLQIYKGAYQGVRNPKAHSLTHDLTEVKAAQYLVFASLLARRVEEATLVGRSVPNIGST